MSEFADTDPLGAWLAGDWPEARCTRDDEHHCHGPEGAEPGDVWTCPTCGREWTAYEPMADPTTPEIVRRSVERAVDKFPQRVIGWRSQPEVRSEARCWLNAGCVRGYHGVMDEDGCQYGTTGGEA